MQNFPHVAWILVAKQLLDACRQTRTWLDAYEPPGEAHSGELQVHIYPEKPPDPERQATKD
jgi:hypothetical protein